MRNLLKKTGYVVAYLLLVFFVFIPISIAKKRGIIEEINLEENLSWNGGKYLFVTNHPSWLDQFLMVTLRLFHWGTSAFPFIVVANDSIKKILYLDFFKGLSFIIPIERNGSVYAARNDIKRIKAILAAKHNLMIAGAPGRDFKGTEEEIIFSPIKKKPLRKFTNLSGIIATLPGVKTIPSCIEGTDRFYREIEIDGKKEMKFSPWNFFILFLLLGRIRIRIIYSKALVLGGKKKREATKIIQDTVLNSLDYP